MGFPERERKGWRNLGTLETPGNTERKQKIQNGGEVTPSDRI